MLQIACPCHLIGTTVPSKWHAYAKVVAQLCHRGGTTSKKGGGLSRPMQCLDQ